MCFGAGEVKLLVCSDRRETVALADSERPGNPLMILVSPPLPAQGVVEVEHPDRPKGRDIGRPANDPGVK